MQNLIKNLVILALGVTMMSLAVSCQPEDLTNDPIIKKNSQSAKIEELRDKPFPSEYKLLDQWKYQYRDSLSVFTGNRSISDISPLILEITKLVDNVFVQVNENGFYRVFAIEVKKKFPQYDQIIWSGYYKECLDDEEFSFFIPSSSLMNNWSVLPKVHSDFQGEKIKFLFTSTSGNAFQRELYFSGEEIKKLNFPNVEFVAGEWYTEEGNLRGIITQEDIILAIAGVMPIQIGLSSLVDEYKGLVHIDIDSDDPVQRVELRIREGSGITYAFDYVGLSNIRQKIPSSLENIHKIYVKISQIEDGQIVTDYIGIFEPDEVFEEINAEGLEEYSIHINN